MCHCPTCRIAYEAGLARLMESRQQRAGASQEAPTLGKIPARIAERYGTVFCRDCGFAAAYCTCAPTVAGASPDGAESDLARRIREARQRHGGR